MYTVQVVRAQRTAIRDAYVYEGTKAPAKGDLIKVRLATAQAHELVPVRVTGVYGDLIMAADPNAR